MKRVFCLLVISLLFFSCSTDTKLSDSTLQLESQVRSDEPTVEVGTSDIDLPCTLSHPNMNCTEFEKEFSHRYDFSSYADCQAPEDGCKVNLVLSGRYCHALGDYNLFEYSLKSWSVSENCSSFMDCIMELPNSKEILDQMEKDITLAFEGILLVQFEDMIPNGGLYDCSSTAYTTEVNFKRSICSSLCIYKTNTKSSLQYLRTGCDYSCCMRLRRYCRNEDGSIQVSKSSTILHDDCGDIVVAPWVKTCDDLAADGYIIVENYECQSDPCE